MGSGWIGFDLDGVLSNMSGPGENFLNPPVWIGFPAVNPDTGRPDMVLLAKKYLAEKKVVKIVTARVGRFCNGMAISESSRDHAREAIKLWCEKYIGQVLLVTAEKDYDMEFLYDDRAIQVVSDRAQLVSALLERMCLFSEEVFRVASGKHGLLDGDKIMVAIRRLEKARGEVQAVLAAKKL
jgi:hypothetical protein